MITAATLVLTVVSALSIGVLFGWALLTAILFLFSLGRRKELELQPAKAKTVVAATSSVN
jgi:hypothetical protein